MERSRRFYSLEHKAGRVSQCTVSSIPFTVGQALCPCCIRKSKDWRPELKKKYIMYTAICTPNTHIHPHTHTHNIHIYIYIYIYIYIFGAPPLMYLPFFVFFTSFTYLVGRLGEHSLVLVVYLMCCLLVLLVLCEMGEHYLVLIRGPAGIGSNTRVLDPIRAWIEDRRLKMHGKLFRGIFNLRSSIQAGIGSNTRVLDPIPEYSISIPVQVKN